MWKNKLSPSQLTAWLVGALVPTAIELGAGASWLSVLLTTSACLLPVGLCWQWGEAPEGKFQCLVQWGLLVAVLAAFGQQIPKAWPQGGHKAVSLILLALALWSAWKGTGACACVGCVLFWFTVPLYLLLMGTGMAQIRLQWLRPSGETVSALGAVLLLTPAAASIHLNNRKRPQPRLVLIPALCTLASATASGVLSPAVAAVEADPFYEMIRSLSSANRFEAVLSAGITVGWFSMLALCLSLCGQWAESFRPSWGKRGMTAAAFLGGLGVLLSWSVPGPLLLLLVTILWVCVPLITPIFSKIKKSK